MTERRPLKLAHVPASRGVQWVALGWRAFASKPFAFSALFAVFIVVASLAALLGIAGNLLVLAAVPLLTLGFMIGTRAAEAGRVPSPADFIEPLRGPAKRAVLLLGALYAVAALLVLALAGAVDGGAWEALQVEVAGGNPDADKLRALLADPRLAGGMVTLMTLFSVLSLPFWHAPALAHWAGQGVAQSLFSSVLAIWHNRGAFAAYFALWTALVLGFGLVAGAASALLGLRALLPLLALPAGLLFSTVFYASLYFTYRDSFERSASVSADSTSLG